MVVHSVTLRNTANIPVTTKFVTHMAGFAHSVRNFQDMENKEKCYEVRFVDGQGNGLFATKDIVPGELVFKEYPFVWNAFKNLNNKQSSFCYTCGSAFRDSSVPSISCSCCQVCFCSKECESMAVLLGHRFICASYKRHGLVDSFTQTDRSGHFALALQCYAQVAAEYMKTLSTAQPLAEAVKVAAHTVLSGYHADDFCRSKHAIRTGQLEVLNENLFETMIAPAYFATSGLEDAQAQIHSAFAALPLSVWVNTVNEDAKSDETERTVQVRAAFLNQEEDGIFTSMFLRKLIGTFSVNNHHVRLNESSDAADKATAGTSSEPTTVFSAAHSKSVGNAAAPVQLLGTALYPTVSKMNHSCACNTANSHSGRDVQLAIYATAHIPAGTELTTTYLHQRAASSKPQSRRSRHKALLQYLFACRCVRCEDELQQQREERRNARAAAGKSGVADSDADSEDSYEESSEEEQDTEQDGVCS